MPNELSIVDHSNNAGALNERPITLDVDLIHNVRSCRLPQRWFCLTTGWVTLFCAAVFGPVFAQPSGQLARQRSETPWSFPDAPGKKLFSTRGASVALEGQGAYLELRDFPTRSTGLTLELWFRPASTDGCMPLANLKGQYSLRLDVCETLELHFPENGFAHQGTHRITPQWHHIGLVIDSNAHHLLYLDGKLDASPDWDPEGKLDQASSQYKKNGGKRTTQMAETANLLIGSAGTRSRPTFHGYVRDLRLLNGARSMSQVSQDAFRVSFARDDGLIGAWPLRQHLRSATPSQADVLLVGGGSLAVEAPKIPVFPPARSVIKPASSPPLVIPTTPTSIPRLAASPKVGGSCSREYAGAASVALGPGRSLFARFGIDKDDLVVCTSPIFGAQGGTSKVDIGIGTGTGRSIVVHLRPDGTYSVDRTGAVGAGDIVAKTTRASTFQGQNDSKPLSAPWWSGEVRVPLTFISPNVGNSLRLAVFIEQLPVGPDAAAAKLTGPARATWPLGAATDRPSSWATMGTASAGPLLVTRNSDRGSAHPLKDPAPVNALRVPTLNAPPVEATTAGFDNACPWASSAGWVTIPPAKWPLVRANHFAQASGTMNSVDYSSQDSIAIHDSHDIDMKISLDPESAYLGMDGNSPGLVLESESIHFPAEVRPLPNDHVTARGHYIYDCGHTDPRKAEIHGLDMFETDREEYRSLWLGTQRVRVAHVLLNSDNGPDSALLFPGYFNASLDGPFIFRMSLPQGGSKIHPYLSVISGDPNQISAELSGSDVVVTVRPSSSTGTSLWTLAVGYADKALSYYRPYSIVLDSITVFDDHDAGAPDCGNGSSVLNPLGLPTHDCGEWFMDVNFNGHGVQIFEDSIVSDTDAAGGPEYAIGATFPVIASSETRIRLHISGFESDDGVAFNVGGTGDEITQSHGDIWDLGSVTDAADKGQRTYKPGPDYSLKYHVVSGPIEALGSTADTTFWANRLLDEINDSRLQATDLGLLNVPTSLYHPAYISEYPFKHGSLMLLGLDVDRYKFSVNDFAEVAISPLPVGAVSSLEWKSQSGCADFGSNSGSITVASDNGGRGDFPYALRVQTTPRILPPDWGVGFDQTGIGRLVDLTTKTGLFREIQMPCAWQHIPNETQLYRVKFPPETQRPSNCPRGGICPAMPICEYNQRSSLVISANGMSLSGAGATKDDVLTFESLSQAIPSSEAIFSVSSQGARVRSSYQLDVQWSDATFIDHKHCEIERGIRNTAKTALETKVDINELLGIIKHPSVVRHNW